jgi:hypothetical protein
MAYCTSSQVASFLQVPSFSGSTTPSGGHVDDFIAMAESRVEQLTGTAWHTDNALSVTEERVRIQKVRSNMIQTRGRIQLSHYPILAFAKNDNPSLANAANGNVKIWSATGYKDYLKNSEGKTLGTSVTDTSNDMWVDTERGIIYLNSYSLHNLMNGAPSGVDGYVSYKYGYATTPDDIKLATIYFTASTIAANDDLNLMPEGDDSMDNATKSQKFEDMAMKILKDNKRLDRDMTMARAVGGFGTGMVTP